MGERLGPVWVHAPCRVVRVVDALGRRRFAYGTLAGHPERGEEAFVVELDDTGAVWLAVTALLSSHLSAHAAAGTPAPAADYRRLSSSTRPPATGIGPAAGWEH